MRPFFKHPTCAPCFLETSNRKNPSFRVSQKHTPFPNLCYARSVTATTMQTNGDAGARSVAAFPKAEVRLRTRLTRPENTKEQKGTERNDGFSKNWNYPALRPPALRHRTIQQSSNPTIPEPQNSPLGSRLRVWPIRSTTVLASAFRPFRFPRLRPVCFCFARPLRALAPLLFKRLAMYRFPLFSMATGFIRPNPAKSDQIRP